MKKEDLVNQIEARANNSRSFKLIYRLGKVFFGAQKAVDSLPSEASLSEYCQKLIDGLGIKIETKLPQWADQQGQAVLVIAPHEFHAEPQILLALLKKRTDDVHFVAYPSAEFMLPPEHRDRIIPIAPTFFASDAPKPPLIKPKKRVEQRVKRILFGSTQASMTMEEINQMNERSLHIAAKLLTQGKIVVIFPTANHDIFQAKWGRGIGEIVFQLKSNYPGSQDVLLQPLNVSQHRLTDFLRKMREKFVKGQDVTPITVRLDWGQASKIDSMSDLPAEINPRRIADFLQQAYRQSLGVANE